MRQHTKQHTKQARKGSPKSSKKSSKKRFNKSRKTNPLPTKRVIHHNYQKHPKKTQETPIIKRRPNHHPHRVSPNSTSGVTGSPQSPPPNLSALICLPDARHKMNNMHSPDTPSVWSVHRTRPTGHPHLFLHNHYHNHNHNHNHTPALIRPPLPPTPLTPLTRSTHQPISTRPPSTTSTNPHQPPIPIWSPIQPPQRPSTPITSIPTRISLRGSTSSICVCNRSMHRKPRSIVLWNVPPWLHTWFASG